jgi:ABC-type lipoprotein release transport system permease subunit
MIDLAAKLGGGHVVIQHPEYLDTPTLTRTVEHTDQVRAAAAADPAVRKAVDRITGQAMVATASHNVGVGFVAYDAAAEDDTTLSFLRGIDGSLDDPKGVVLGARVAKNLGVGLGDKVVYTLMDRSGEIVSGMGRVSGVVHTGAASVDGALMLVPIAAMRSVLGYAPDEATTVAVYVNDLRKSSAVAERLQPQLAAIGTAKALTWSEAQPDLSGFIAIKVGGARFLELVILVLVAAGIFNTLFMSVMERRREFGILAAIGCSRSRIFALVMWESLWLALVGLVAAAVVTTIPYAYLHGHGYDLAGKMDGLEVAGLGMPSVLRVGIFPENALLIVSFAIGATLLAGLWPAWQASRVAPVDAIKMV